MSESTDYGTLTLRPSKNKKKSSYSSSSSKPIQPPKPLTAEELKARIKSAPLDIKSYETKAGDAKKQGNILFACTIMVLIIWICVYMFVPSTYEAEEEREKVVITAKKTETVKEKVKVPKYRIYSYIFPLIILFFICLICGAFAVSRYIDYEDYTGIVGYTQEELLKWQSQLKSLAPAAV
jgi:hypothetical protein